MHSMLFHIHFFNCTCSITMCVDYLHDSSHTFNRLHTKGGYVSFGSISINSSAYVPTKWLQFSVRMDGKVPQRFPKAVFISSSI